MTGKYVKTAILFSILMSSCQAEYLSTVEKPAIIASTVNSLNNLPAAKLTAVQEKPVLSGKIISQDSQPNKKTLTFSVNYASPGQGFKTQAVDCFLVSRVKISVTGINITGPLFAAAADENHTVAAGENCSFSATVDDVPFGKVRIATVEAYDADNNLLSGATVKSVFDLNAGPVNADISYNSTPAAKIIEAFIGINARNDLIATRINLMELNNKIRAITGQGPDFITHPSMVNTAAIISDLIKNSDIMTLDTDNPAYKTEAVTVSGSIEGLLGSDKVDIIVNDPASRISTNISNGGFTITNVTPGDWKVTLISKGQVAYQLVNPVSISANPDIGTISFEQAGTPAIAGISASEGASGDIITITGTGFYPAAGINKVKFGTTEATAITNVTATGLKVAVPNGLELGSQDITVTVGNKISEAAAFTVVSPTISDISPKSGFKGTVVTITGTGFTGVTQVMFNNVAAVNYDVISSTELKATVPDTGTTGQVSLIIKREGQSDLTTNFTIDKIIYVNAGAEGNNDGFGWANAFRSLQSALEVAGNGQEIWVAGGIYKPTAGNDRNATFQLKPGVKIFGGFAGSEALITDRTASLSDFVTFLSGDLSGNGSAGDGDSFHIVTGANNALLDGVTIQHGFANGEGNSGKGAGMFNLNSSPELTNVFFFNNAASENGGGISNDNSSPTLTNAVFANNISANSGGAISNYNSSNPSLINVTFNNNSSVFSGGAMANSASSPTLISVTFADNTVTNSSNGFGAAIFNSNSSPALTNVAFANNISANSGGGIYNTNSSPVLTNVTFFRNSATAGGGMYSINSSPVVKNSIFWGNTAPSGANILNSTANVNISFSDIQGGVGTIPGVVNGGNNLNTDPFFVINTVMGGPFDIDGQDNRHRTGDDGLALRNNSPVRDSGAAAGAPTKDITGANRPQGAGYSMGAYEK
jgi:hypothetical protein